LWPTGNMVRGAGISWILETASSIKPECLDAGCGIPLPAYLDGLGCEAHGLDYLRGKGDYPKAMDPQGVDRDVTWEGPLPHGTMSKAPFPDNTFDRITCVSVLEHILSAKALMLTTLACRK